MKNWKLSWGLFVALAAWACINDANAEGMGLRGFGGQLGFTNIGGQQALTIGANADMGEINSNVVFHPSATYWQKNYNSWLGDFKVSALRFNADTRYYIPLDGNVTPYVGGGVALVVGRVAVGDVGVSVTNWELNLMGGAEMPISPILKGFGELRIEDSNTHIAFGLKLPFGS